MSSTGSVAARLARLADTVVSRLPTRSRWTLARRLVTRANVERDAQRYAAATALYEEALRLQPDHPRFLVQYGHMLKEAGDYAAAERCYGIAARALPDDPDIAIQLGHFYKVAGRPDEAADAYRRATQLRPGWREAEEELARLGTAPATQADTAEPLRDRDLDMLAPELLPTERSGAEPMLREGIHVRRLGAARLRSRGAYRRVLRGVEAIHGFIVASARVDALTILLDGAVIRRVPLDPVEPGPGGQHKYVFNVWHDFSDAARGQAHVELRATRAGGSDYLHRALLDIVDPVTADAIPDSDAIVTPPQPGEPLEEAINVRPSMVRAAPRGVLPHAPRAILVQRADQLGDLVCSVPALQRLRALFPDSRLVILVTPANADLARTLDMVDAVVEVDFPEGPDGRRTLPLAAQEALRQRLTAYEFDVAIDLAETGGSRPLLLLSGAPFLYGFKDREFPWLSAGFELAARDRGNQHERAATAHKLVALIDGLGEIAARPPCVLRRHDIDPGLLARFGIAPGEAFAVLHTGARLPYTRWPGFAALTRLLLDRTGLTIVLMGEEAAAADPADARVRVVTDRLSFDQFDALISFCALFVGNDSGPKHLASLRGAPVVSLHMARLNWSEWGQEASGLIVSRRVPCAGCGIGQDAEECGKDFACLRHIGAEEVFAAAARLLRPAGGVDALQSAS